MTCAYCNSTGTAGGKTCPICHGQSKPGSSAVIADGVGWGAEG